MSEVTLKELLTYDWVCRECWIGLYSQNIEKSDDQSRPLCPQCEAVVFDPDSQRRTQRKVVRELEVYLRKEKARAEAEHEQTKEALRLHSSSETLLHLHTAEVARIETLQNVLAFLHNEM